MIFIQMFAMIGIIGVGLTSLFGIIVLISEAIGNNER
jgi:hypothetical protein